MQNALRMANKFLIFKQGEIMEDLIKIGDVCSAVVASNKSIEDIFDAMGQFHFRCTDAEGNLKWEETLKNTIMDEGKSALLTAGLKGSVYTAAVYIGLISGTVGYVSPPVVGNTMLAHATWVECGSSTNYPLVTPANRLTATFGTASIASPNVTLATSASSNFTIGATGGTVKGAMVCFNAATNVIGSTAGSLWAAGLFSGDKIVVPNDVIQVSYQVTLS
jgi:hypothetical protein